LANALQDALANVNLTGPLSGSLGVTFQSPFHKPAPPPGILEDNTGVTLNSDSRVFTTPAGGPDLTESFDPYRCVGGSGTCTTPPYGANCLCRFDSDCQSVVCSGETFPTLGATTPSSTPYGLGIVLATTTFNQLLKALTEKGFLNYELTEFSLGGPPLTLTAGVLSTIIPEFASLMPPGCVVSDPCDPPLKIRLAPTIAPVLSGDTGPSGELGDLRLPNLVVDIISPSDPTNPYLRIAADVRTGFNATTQPICVGGTSDGQVCAVNSDCASPGTCTGSELAFEIGQPLLENITVVVVNNPIGANVEDLQTNLPQLLVQAFGALTGGALGGFPLPSFLGVQPTVVEVGKAGRFLAVYLNL
jgi:hypothetical protein